MIVETKIKDLFIIEPELIEDERGYFARIFDKDWTGRFDVVQANVSFNKKKGTLRGMHFQKKPMTEDKIVRCTRGAIYDVAVDLRANSKTYGKWVAVELTEGNCKSFIIPKGFAHGFQTLVDNCEVMYFMSEVYSPEHSSGVRWNDPKLKMKWPVKKRIMSGKDKLWPLIK